MPVKQAVISSFLSRTRDRFSEYNEPIPLEERFAIIGRLDGIDAAEVVFPYEASDANELKALSQRHGVSLAAINVNIKAEPEFRDGALSVPDPAVRRRAVEFIRNAKDFALAVGAPRVTCCPLSDGHEFSFQADYRKAWAHMIDALGEAAQHRPEMPLMLEYKPKETRGRCFLSTAAKTLLMIREIGQPNLGITIDFGHAIYGGETPAESLCLAKANDVPVYVHINDNDGTWDWDYMACSHNLLAYAEFLFYLQQFGYQDYLTIDASPTRWDKRRFFEATARWTNRLWDQLRELDQPGMLQLMDGSRPDYMEMWEFLETRLFFPEA